jgi:hypothetical protein
MSDATPAEAPDEHLAWESLGAHGTARAFRTSLVELLLRPGAFFRKMALTGGLNEPMSFFGILLAVAVVVAFAAALGTVLMGRPATGHMPAEQYMRLVLPAQVTGLASVLLPLVVALVAGAMVFLGTLFHAAAKPFGAANWEGSVSIWLYSASGALVPLILSLLLVFLLSAVSWALGAIAPTSRAAMLQVGHWVNMGLLAVGILAATVGMIALTISGCANAFGMDPLLATAAGLLGILASAATVTAWLLLVSGDGVLNALLSLSGGAAAACALAAFSLGVRSSFRRSP